MTHICRSETGTATSRREAALPNAAQPPNLHGILSNHTLMLETDRLEGCDNRFKSHLFAERCRPQRWFNKSPAGRPSELSRIVSCNGGPVAAARVLAGQAHVRARCAGTASGGLDTNQKQGTRGLRPMTRLAWLSATGPRTRTYLSFALSGILNLSFSYGPQNCHEMTL